MTTSKPAFVYVVVGEWVAKRRRWYLSLDCGHGRWSKKAIMLGIKVRCRRCP